MSVKDKYRVVPIKTEECKEWFLKKHYAKRIPNSIFTFGIYAGSLLQGVVSYGMTANNNLNEIVQGVKAIELNRLVINDDVDKNTLSFFVSQSLKMLPKPMVVISYADSGQGHHGYIYQATNWIYTGLGKGDYEFRKNGRQYHRKNIYDLLGTGSLENAKKHGYEVVKVEPKHRYIFLTGNKKQKKKMIEQLPWQIEPYPKGENIRYDADYKCSTQTTLF
jgi:hypothetical protein